MSNVDVEALYMYFNLTSTNTQLLNGKVPWRGGRTKDSQYLQILTEALTTFAYTVLDAYASTCW